MKQLACRLCHPATFSGTVALMLAIEDNAGHMPGFLFLQHMQVGVIAHLDILQMGIPS